jgi:hypothetical protein
MSCDLKTTNEASYELYKKCFGVYVYGTYVVSAWILATLIFTMMEQRLGDHGTESQCQPLST